ncbi:MAG: hypothetical protein HQL63_11765 [Magnetococcales bacterium]|nr:hypothetical protein [Magnetococcales bacterium]
MENIDDFNRGVGLILGNLYQTFPIPTILKIAELEAFEDVPDPTRKVRRLLVYSATMYFLQEERFLRTTGAAGKKGHDMFANVILTSKGLAALSKTPGALATGQNTAGDVLAELGRDMLKRGTWESFITVVRTILAG